MRFPTSSLRPVPSTSEDPIPERSGRRRPGRRALAVTAGAVVLVLSGAGAAVASAHKSVTLDVDGATTRVSTFAGSVDGLLHERAVAVGGRDSVSVAGALHDGATVVVRHAHMVTVRSDGAERVVWTTALTADEALDTLAARGGDVALVASRSNPGGRLDLALDLTLHGPALVRVDGKTLQAPDSDVSVGTALADLGVVLGPLDEVSVVPAGDGVQVVVVRVVVEETTVTSDVPFATTNRNDPTRSVGVTTVLTAGVPGVRTQVQEVTTADGIERSRVTLSDQVIRAAVDQVVAVGTKARPVAPAAAPAPAAPTGGSGGGLNWAALAGCESGGRPTAVSASGRYYGLYQFSLSTWAAVGGSGLPSQASAAEQTARAQALYARSGAGQWPVCGKLLFS